jgi:hypothetical protein
MAYNMKNYHFAALDSVDIDDVRRLESTLAAKYGRNILVIAYEQSGRQTEQESLSAGIEDDSERHEVDELLGQYGREQTQMESGIYPQ